MPIQGGELPLLRNHSTFDLSFYFSFVIVIRLELLLAELLALAVEAVLRFSFGPFLQYELVDCLKDFSCRIGHFLGTIVWAKS